MSNIINAIAFGTYRPTVVLGNQTVTKIIEQSITTAHSDLREVLGDAFYFDVIKNQGLPAYADLLNGSDYTQGDFTFQHEGLKSLVSDYTYARYLYEANVQHTPNGMVTKTNQDSQHVDRNMIKDLVKQVNVDAAKKWELIEDYLQANINDFPVYAKSQESGGVDNINTFNSTRFTFLSTGKK